MTRKEPAYAHKGTKKFTLVSILKLTVVISIFLAIGVGSQAVNEFTFLVVASISIFAEHFAMSRRSEFFYLAGLPAMFWVLFVFVFTTPFETVSAANAWDSVGSFFAVLVLTTILSTVFSAMSVVMVCVMCGIIFKLTGVRLLKFDWRD